MIENVKLRSISAIKNCLQIEGNLKKVENLTPKEVIGNQTGTRMVEEADDTNMDCKRRTLKELCHDILSHCLRSAKSLSN